MSRRLQEQVIVITGASSGVGRETALAAAQKGASLVVAARNSGALASLADEVERLGGRAEVQVTDVAEWPQVEELARFAVERFGRIDTWINCAAATVYGTVEELTPEEMTRTIQVILLGQMYGMKAALEPMRRQDSGTIINVASALAVRAVPLQSAYCAAKHGIRGFAESLRMELAHENSGVKVTTLLPSSINTPLFEHARSKIGVLPKPVPPIYEPRVVADAILHAAEHPQAEVVVGGGGKGLELLQRVAPRTAGAILLKAGKVVEKQRTSEPDDGTDNLFQASAGRGRTDGQFGQKSKSTSLYTTHLEQHPERIRLLIGLATALVVGLAARD